MLKDVLQKLRNKRGMNQFELAEALDLSQSTIASWENGSRKPDIYTLVRLADYFGVTTDELLDRKQEGEMDREQQEIWELREHVRRDPERRYMFSFAKDGDIKDLKKAIAIIDALKGVED